MAQHGKVLGQVRRALRLQGERPSRRRVMQMFQAPRSPPMAFRYVREVA